MPSTTRSQSLYSICFWLLLLATCAVAILKMPFTKPDGQFWDYAQEYVHTGHVHSTFRPVTYSWLIGLADKPFGTTGVSALQAGMYLLSAACVLGIARTFLGKGPAPYVLSLLVMLNPDLPSSIPKAWDTLITLVTLVGFTIACLKLSTSQRRLPWILCMSVAWGVGTAVRPNLLLMGLPLLFILWNRFPRWWATFAACCAGSAAVMVACVVLAHGSYCSAGSGPYNEFAGSNPYTEQSLLTTLNAESSIDMALQAAHVPYGGDKEQPWLDAYYRSQTVQFITHHPLWALRQDAVKLFTLLRPDTKVHPLLTPAGLIKGITSLPFPFWLVMLLVTRKLLWEDIIVIACAIGYMLPFILINADPRFRTPLDAVLLIHALVLLCRKFWPASTLRPAPSNA